MTVRTLVFFGPELNDKSMFDLPAASAWSVVSTPAPTQGLYRIQLNAGNNGAANIGPDVAITADSHVAMMMREARFATDITAGNVKTMMKTDMPSGGYGSLRWVGESGGSGEAHIGLYDTSNVQKGLSTSTFAKDTDVSAWLHWDGVNAELFINGVSEIKVATTDKPTNSMVTLGENGNVGGQLHWRAGGLIDAATRAELYGAEDVEVDRLDPDGDTSEDDTTGVPDATDHYKNWDDFVSGGASDSDTSYNLFGQADHKQVSTLTTHTPGQTIRCAVHHNRGRAATAAKTGKAWARIKEGANVAEVLLPNFGGSAYLNQMAVFDLAPDGGAWTQADVDALEAGLRSDADNDVNIRISSLAIELVSAGGPPAAAAGFAHSFGTIIG